MHLKFSARLLCLGLVALAACSPGAGQKVAVSRADHAVIVCEALLRSLTPVSAGLEIVDQSIAGSAVTITMRRPNERGMADTFSHTCVFSYDEETAGYHFNIPDLDDQLAPLLGPGAASMTDEERVAALQGNDRAKEIIMLNMDVLLATARIWSRMEQYPVKQEFTSLSR